MKKLSEGNIYKTFILFSLPLVLSAVISQAYGTVDTVIAGQYLGDPGLAATGATAPLISMISSLFWGYGAGFGMYVARLFGAGEFEKLRRAVYTHVVLVIGVAVLLGSMAIAFREPIFDFLNINDPTLRKDAAKYFIVYMGGFFMIILNINFVFCFHAIGVSTFPFIVSTLSAFLNIGGNILNVAVFRMGVDGLAVATAFAATVVNILYFLRFRAAFRELRLEKTKTPVGLDVIREGLPYSLPVTVQQMAMYFASFFLSPMVNGISLAAPAAYVVVTRIYDVNATIYQNSAKTLSNYTAQCVGEGRLDKVGRGFIPSIVQGAIYLAPVLALFLIFPEFTASWFYKADASPETVDMTLTFIRYCLPFIGFNFINNIFHNLYRGLKKMNLLMVSTIFGSIVRIVVSAILTPTYGMNGFYIGWVVSWAAECLLCVAVFCIPRLLPAEVKRFA